MVLPGKDRNFPWPCQFTRGYEVSKTNNSDELVNWWRLPLKIRPWWASQTFLRMQLWLDHDRNHLFASRMPKLPVQNTVCFFSKCRCIVRCVRSLKIYKKSSLYKKNGTVPWQLRSCNFPLPRASQTSHGLYPRRPGSVKLSGEIYMGFCQALQTFLSLDQCVCVLYMKWCLERQKSSSASSLQSKYYLHLTDNLWIYPIGNFCMSSFGK